MYYTSRHVPPLTECFPPQCDHQPRQHCCLNESRRDTSRYGRCGRSNPDAEKSRVSPGIRKGKEQEPQWSECCKVLHLGSHSSAESRGRSPCSRSGVRPLDRHTPLRWRTGHRKCCRGSCHRWRNPPCGYVGQPRVAFRSPHQKCRVQISEGRVPPAAMVFPGPIPSREGSAARSAPGHDCQREMKPRRPVVNPYECIWSLAEGELGFRGKECVVGGS